MPYSTTRRLPAVAPSIQYIPYSLCFVFFLVVFLLRDLNGAPTFSLALLSGCGATPLSGKFLAMVDLTIVLDAL